MIRFVDSRALEEAFYAVCRGSAFGCKLAAVAGAYGFGRDLARFWVGGGAAFCLLDGTLSVAGTPADREEARAFARMAGAGRLFCPAGLVGPLGLAAGAGGLVMAKKLPPAPGPDREAGWPDIGEMWALLARAGMALDREGFYLDLSHRLRHGVALAAGEYAGGRLVGCALAFLTEDAALMPALAVEEGFRRQGLGTGLVRRLERALPGKTLYLMRGAGENRGFYLKLGFRTAGRWREGVLSPPFI